MDAFEKMTKHLLHGAINIETNRETGRKYLMVDGQLAGTYDTDIGINIISNGSAWSDEEKLVALTLIASGNEDINSIADYILKFRQFVRNNDS